jgi:hypothetical protein
MARNGTRRMIAAFVSTGFPGGFDRSEEVRMDEKRRLS